jgi:HPt (histidine-containing phosphotransfer) domain-containing protein
MTFGDRSLEREVLALFDRQASMLIERMKRVGAAAVPSLAHTLKGSARGIGAQRVARAAEKVERAAVAGEDEVKAALVELEEATTEARATIADLLRAL